MTVTEPAPTSRGDQHGSALRDTAHRADALLDWRRFHLDVPPDEPGWVGCDAVDAAFLSAWEALAISAQQRYYGRTAVGAAVGYVLDYYAELPGQVGGAFFRLARRVPRLGPEALAFHRHPDDGYCDGIALRDGRFWCLPGDPAADDPAATVVADEAALAAVLRAQVRAYADRFLAWYRPAVPMARRALLGAFFDGLDTGLWLGDAYQGPHRERALADARTVLPERTPEFRDGSTLHLLTDARGRVHLTRTRVGCCRYYLLSEAGEACFTCARTPAAERPRLAAEWDEEM